MVTMLEIIYYPTSQASSPASILGSDKHLTGKGTYEVYPHEMDAHEVHAYEMYVREVQINHKRPHMRNHLLSKLPY
jgi:hypothetical protein